MITPIKIDFFTSACAMFLYTISFFYIFLRIRKHFGRGDSDSTDTGSKPSADQKKRSNGRQPTFVIVRRPIRRPIRRPVKKPVKKKVPRKLTPEEEGLKRFKEQYEKEDEEYRRRTKADREKNNKPEIFNYIGGPPKVKKQKPSRRQRLFYSYLKALAYPAYFIILIILGCFF